LTSISTLHAPIVLTFPYIDLTHESLIHHISKFTIAAIETWN